METKKKPKRRFRGYNEVWEQRKVSDVADIIAGGTPSTSVSSYWEPKEIPWLSSGEVHKKYIYFTDNKISTEGMNNSSARLIKENSVLIALAGQGKTRGTVAINRIPLTTNQSIAAMTFSEEIIPEFVFCNLDGRYDEIRRMSSGDGARGGLNKQIVGDIEVPYTSIQEQEKIGSFFRNLDNLITLHQRKYEKLQSLKKAYLSEMFPLPGEKRPRRRFAGFTGDWEQRKLGDVFKEYSEKKHEELPPLTIIQGGGTILREESDRNLQYDKSSLSNYKMIKKNDFIVHLRSFEGGLEKANSDGIISPAYHTLHGENTDSRFYYPFFRSRRFIEVLLKPHVYGIRDGKSIDIDGMKTINIPVPTLEEQQKIGNYIEQMDNLIALHQRKLAKLQALKKAHLTEMFP